MHQGKLRQKIKKEIEFEIKKKIWISNEMVKFRDWLSIAKEQELYMIIFKER